MRPSAPPYEPPPTPPVDRVGIEMRAASFTKRSIKRDAKRRALEIVTSMIDLTTLEGADTEDKVRRLCRKGLRPDPNVDLPSVAAICVYPTMVTTAREALEGSGVQVAAVATAFPSGQSFLDIRLAEVRETVEKGADEIDMVISRGTMLRGDAARVHDEIAAVKDACGRAHLKVILETGELGDYDRVRLASRIAMDAGADFIKTSTGKIGEAASLPVVLVMLEAIRDFFHETGRVVGMKPAGGIRTAKQAWHYLCMVKETLGDAWLTPDRFRLGASSLLNDVLLQAAKLDRGNYQSSDYFGKD